MISEGKITIKTIANELGLSLTTVSRVLNGTSEKYRISKSTQELVLNKADELGYIPNMAAKTLRLSQSKSIGLLLPSLNNPFFSFVASTVSLAFTKRGYVVLMSECNGDLKEEKKILNELMAQNLQGILVIPTGERKTYDRLKASKIPAVFLDRFFSDGGFYYVTTDHYQSGIQLMAHLLENGHEKIACIQGDLNVVSNKLRVEAYEDVVKKNKLSFKYVGGQSFTSREGYLETKKILKLADRPTAILALSDTILLGVLKALKEEHISVPEDISVVSIDNSSYLDYLEVPITSVSQPIGRIAQLAIKILLELIESPEELKDKRPDKAVLFDSKVIFRNSVKNLKFPNKS